MLTFEHAQKRHFRDLPPHLIRQLSVRRWSQHNGKWKLFKKDDDKALLEGKSPDSADAMALAWFNLRPTDITPPQRYPAQRPRESLLLISMPI